MKLDYLKEKEETVSAVLLGVSAFFAVMILVRLAAFSAASAKAERLVGAAVAQGAADANAIEGCVAKAKDVAEDLKKKNLFSPPPAKKHPVKEVRGIAGNRVLIGDEWYGPGASIGDAKVVAIEPTYAKIEWEGRTKIFAPISAAGTEKTEDKDKSEVRAGEGETEDRDISSLSREERVRRRAERIRMIKERKEARRRER